MPILTSDDQVMFAYALAGRYDLFTQYYFDGWTPLKNQFVEHYAPQRTVTHLGGVGSGKTSGKGRSFLTKTLTIPYYLGLNTSVSAFQAKLMHEQLLPLVEGHKPLEPFIKDVKSRPYPVIETIFGSKFACMTAGVEARLIRGSEWDEINGDEFGYERSEMTVNALRGRLRGTRPDGTFRMARLTITTTPTDVPWLRTFWDRGDKKSGSDELDLKRYYSLRSTLYDNTYIPDWQREEILALFPDWGDTEFPVKFIDACEDVYLNDMMEQMVNPVILAENGEEIPGKPLPGAAVIELPRIGVTLWEMPWDPLRQYVLASDPGTLSPPKRNAPVVMVWDVTEKPYILVYFHWVSGGGSYMPWLSSFKYAAAKYRPVFKGIDSTGPQKAIDELVLERDGFSMDSVNFAHDKAGMLNALKLLLQNHELRFPAIKGLRHQLRTYKVKDDDIAQDLVATMMVFAHLERFLPTSGGVEVRTIKKASSGSRNARSRRATRGGRRAPR